MLRSPVTDMWLSLFAGYAGEVADSPPHQTALAASIQHDDILLEGCSGCNCVAGLGPVGDHLDMENVLHVRDFYVRYGHSNTAQFD